MNPSMMVTTDEKNVWHGMLVLLRANSSSRLTMDVWTLRCKLLRLRLALPLRGQASNLLAIIWPIIPVEQLEQQQPVVPAARSHVILLV